MTIKGFTGIYRFLSNSYPVELRLNGISYSTVDEVFEVFQNSTSTDKMYQCLRAKFASPELRRKLVSTSGEVLDDMSDGNSLGLLLMRVRDEFLVNDGKVMGNVYLDLETTGFNPQFEDILEICIIDDDGKPLVNTLVDPVKRKVWPEAETIHHISPKMAAGGITLHKLRPQIIEALRGQNVVIYNAKFDSGFLVEELKVAKSVQCCMLRYAEYMGQPSKKPGQWQWHKQIEAAEYIGYKFEGEAHRALADTLACRAIWLWLDEQGKSKRVRFKREESEITKKKAFWYLSHPESNCIWIVEDQKTAERELADGLVVEISATKYYELEKAGWDSSVSNKVGEDKLKYLQSRDFLNKATRPVFDETKTDRSMVFNWLTSCTNEEHISLVLEYIKSLRKPGSQSKKPRPKFRRL